MTLTSKGQVAIPQDIRRRLGLMPGTRVVFDVVGDSVRIRRAGDQSRGEALVAHLRNAGRRSPLPDFYIGAHAAIEGLALLTRDPKRYRSYFPGLRILSP